MEKIDYDIDDFMDYCLLEMEGVLNCNIYFINAVCKYKYKTGILMIFDEEEKYLKISDYSTSYNY